MKPPIRFKFDIEKFIACVALFAEQGFKDLDKLKICKLLYYVDKYHLLRFGKPVIGDMYVHLDNGPVPSKSLDIMNEVICRDKIFITTGVTNKDKLKEYVKVKKHFGHSFPVFETIKEANLDCLSASEQEAIRDTIKRYGKCSPLELIELTHKDASWQETQNTEEIDYRLFFQNEPEAKTEALEYMESLALDSELMTLLECSG